MSVESHRGCSTAANGGCDPTPEMVQLAARRLRMTEEGARACARPIMGLEGTCLFSPPGRGAGRLIVSRELETLWAASTVSPAMQIGAFRCGFRS